MRLTLPRLFWSTLLLSTTTISLLSWLYDRDATAILGFSQGVPMADSGGYPTSRSPVRPQEWPIGPLETVYLAYEDSIHYAIDTPLGIAEWNTTLPSGGAVVHFEDSVLPFTVAMFHEIRCLNILREILMDLYQLPTVHSEYEAPWLAKHCMNYLKHAVLCRADLRLESVKSPTGSKKAVSDITHTCKDWTAVYHAAEENYKATSLRMST